MNNFTPESVLEIKRRYETSVGFYKENILGNNEGFVRSLNSGEFNTFSSAYYSLASKGNDFGRKMGEKERRKWARNKRRKRKAEHVKSVKKADKEAKSLDTEMFFNFTKNFAKKFTKKELEILNKEIDLLEIAYEDAATADQESLGAELLNEALLRMKEAAVIVKGYDRYIEYDKLYKYFDRIRDGKISLTHFESFMRPVPKDVLAKKKKTDGLFDGYAILHSYDPKKMDDKGRTKTKEETKKSETRKKAKDPILFGVHYGSGRLWFIADWIDETCDLTFNELVQTMAGLEGEDSYGKATLSV